MHDAHMHLDFMSNGTEVARDARIAGCHLLAATVTPAGFVAARARFAPFDNVSVGLGLHPWWVSSPDDCKQLLPLVEEARFIGEVGLDFSKRYAITRSAQEQAFIRVARACAISGERMLSIHSVRAARETLDILEAAGTFESCACIFHWYSGPSDQLKRAIDAGCYFSVNERMLATGKGREYVKAIPEKRLLLETDAPPKRDEPYAFSDIAHELARTSSQIAQIKGARSLETLEQNARTLFNH